MIHIPGISKGHAPYNNINIQQIKESRLQVVVWMNSTGIVDYNGLEYRLA